MTKAIKLISAKLISQTALSIYAIIMTGIFLYGFIQVIIALALGSTDQIPYDLFQN